MAQISYQTSERDGSVGGGTLHVPEIADLATADRLARDAASTAESVMVTRAVTSTGVDLVYEWEERNADAL